MLHYERKLKAQGYNFIIGIDEAGRGPLAGPVVAAAVSLLETQFKNRIDDSKKLTPHQRENAFPEIIQKSFFGIGIVDEKVIDSLNILQATRIAMKRAVISLIDKIQDEKNRCIYLLIDGNIRLDIDFPSLGIVRGDSQSLSIASASILAKVTRDRIMSEYDKVYPHYGFIKHKGYPTKMHKLAIKKFGLSAIHRETFNSA